MTLARTTPQGLHQTSGSSIPCLSGGVSRLIVKPPQHHWVHHKPTVFCSFPKSHLLSLVNTDRKSWLKRRNTGYSSQDHKPDDSTYSSHYMSQSSLSELQCADLRLVTCWYRTVTPQTFEWTYRLEDVGNQVLTCTHESIFVCQGVREKDTLTSVIGFLYWESNQLFTRT